jgi:quinohemoprotein ethanol dehydrogenase
MDNQRILKAISIIVFSSALLLNSCSQEPEDDSAESVTEEAQSVSSRPSIQAPIQLGEDRIVNADQETENWLTYGRTYKEQRHSPLTQINESTIDRLGLAWYADMGTMRGLEATPLVIDGVIYVTSAWSIVHAFNAVTGEKLWTHDPQVNRGHARYVCCDVVNRGAAFYGGKIYSGTIDGRLVSVDAENGELVWETQTTPEGEAYSITSALEIAGRNLASEDMFPLMTRKRANLSGVPTPFRAILPTDTRVNG